MSNLQSIKLVLLPQFDGSETRELVEQLTERLKTLRLYSLQVNPESFGSTYDTEVQFDDSVWESRLKNPQANLFVGLGTSKASSTTGDDDKSLLQLAASSPWIGTTVLLGPKIFNGTSPNAGESPVKWFSEYTESKADETETTKIPRNLLFMINGVYVSPEWRKHRLATTLLQNALELIQILIHSQQRQVSVGTCLVFVDEDNPIAKGLYERNGFVQTRKEKYTRVDGEERTALALQLKFSSA
jgi:ribosomal protein S18 acetylase RimI-like enzyme